MTRLTFDAGWDSHPLWSPDGRVLYFASDEDGGGELYRCRADGAGAIQAIWNGPTFAYPGDVTPDGRTLLLGLPADESNWNIHELEIPPPEQDETKNAIVRPLLNSEFEEGGTRLSPDGKWLAYNTDETTPTQVFVRPYPNVNDGRWQVSTDGGINPSWSANGREIYYRNGNKMMAVSVETDPSFRPGRARELFEADYYYAPDLSVQYDLEYPARRRFLMLKEEADTRSTKLVYVGNWVEELNRLVPATTR
jgi:Tol biopolymer transport system component